ncbi:MULTISPECIES: hypothetical protein [Microbacterium]|uniref:hypothetical protein n=1 Tax=Microbacterium TaxID=33882 RepID=UPI002783B2BD|nr:MULTISPECIES: hypothetical protein [Microbacterium]MDQ1085436.1 hypothetical protein [Microbacterium sp. SORGH_AS_0344]MDQ1169258.1 hypothetical protein [Microbacterium proteolyticum]
MTGRQGLRETERDDVPWGRPAIAGIPLPPFLDADERTAYVRSLQTYVALLDEGAPTATTVALLAALERGIPAVGEAWSAELSMLELDVSVATFFPAPWTPERLAPAMDPLEHFSPRFTRGAWRWHFDPEYEATPTTTGWRIERHERGSRTTAELDHRDDLVLLWMDAFRNRFPYPIAHMPSPRAAPVEELAAAARSARTAHAVDMSMPYLARWRTRPLPSGKPGGATR